MIPIERDFKPIKYKMEDMIDITQYQTEDDKDVIGPNNYYLHEIENNNIKTYRYMREGEDYTISNNGILETVTSDGSLNYNQYGEKENLSSDRKDAGVSSIIGGEEKEEIREQIIDSLILDVENVYEHKFAHVGHLRTYPKPIFRRRW